MKTTETENLASARRAIKAVLHLDITKKHKRKLLNAMLWAITEAPGKYNVRYITQAALRKGARKHLRHEHVYPRKWLIEKLLKSPQSVDKITKRAIACVVTKSENKRLNRVPGAGWKRYKQLTISVWDKERERWKLNFSHDR